MDSVWSKSVDLPQFETLQESKKTDVLIIWWHQDFVNGV